MIVFWDEAADDYDDSKQFSSGGDSGSAIYNENKEVVGIHFGSHFNPATGRYFSFACHIELVENQLGLTVPGNRTNLVAVNQPPSSPAVAALDIPIDSDEGEFAVAGNQQQAKEADTNFWHTFKEHLQKSELGRTALQIIHLHGFEIMQLINHNREVMVTWNRRKGPSFTAAIARSVKHAAYKIPTSIEGQSFSDMLSQMGKVLHRHGSVELRNIIDLQMPQVHDLAESIAKDEVSYAEVIEWLDAIGNSKQHNTNG